MTDMLTKEELMAFPSLSAMPTPVRTLITAVILTLGFGMFGALGQIVVHDIIPTFFQEAADASPQQDANDASPPSQRGDLFGGEPLQAAPPAGKPFYKEEQFVWTLKWTHIHLFGMNMIFILLGWVTLCLNIPPKAKTWLVALPFAGVLIDIAAMWLKGYVSPLFFWLHVPGGMMFGLIFLFVAVRALQEMWLSRTGH